MCIRDRHKSVLSSKDSVDKTGQIVFDTISEFYSKRIKFFIKNPIETMVACISVIALIVTTYNFYGKGTEYFATIDPLEAKISIRGRGNFSALEKKEAQSTKKTVIGRYFINCPVYPGQKINGINAAKVVPVEARIG